MLKFSQNGEAIIQKHHHFMIWKKRVDFSIVHYQGFFTLTIPQNFFSALEAKTISSRIDWSKSVILVEIVTETEKIAAAKMLH